MIDFITKIADSRPKANHGIEQFLMTPSSLMLQVTTTLSQFTDKKIIFLGDDDHFSILLAHYGNNVDVTVIEIDDRIIENQVKLSNELGFKNHKIIKYDASNLLDKKLLPHSEYDIFVVNPPYGSKNELYGSKVWISRCLEVLKNYGKGLIILPVDFKYKWSIENTLILQNFLGENNCAIYQLDRDLHSYFDVNDQGLLSSNIWIVKIESSSNLIREIDKNLYR